MITNLKPVSEHLDVVDAELHRVGRTLSTLYFRDRFQLDVDEVLAVVFELEEQGRVKLTPCERPRTIMVTLTERIDEDDN